MPDKPVDDKDTEEWITIGGKKMRIDAGEDKEELTREKMPSARGEKESNTKEALKTYIYKMRHDLVKSPFKPRDEVVFAEYKKAGIVAGLDGGKVNILSEGRMYPANKNHVFKKSELINNIHWDTMTNVDRVQVLKDNNLPAYYNKQNWGNLDYRVREQLLKNVSPAGTTTSTTGIHNPIYNPVNEEKAVSDTIKEEMDRQAKMPPLDEEKKKKDSDKEQKNQF